MAGTPARSTAPETAKDDRRASQPGINPAAHICTFLSDSGFEGAYAAFFCEKN
jgi:hypothetical protein